MGILTKGKYTYGNKTWAVIITITGAKIGDTVFDTTYSRLRSYDGNNFVCTHQKSYVSDGPMINGYLLVASPTTDNRVNFQQGVGDTEGVAALCEDARTGATGDTISCIYFGDTYAIIQAGAGADNAEPGDAWEVSTLTTGIGDIKTASAGTLGYYFDSIAVTTGLRRVIFRPIDRY